MMNPNLPELTINEKRAAGILADAMKADTEAQAVQAAAADAYKGDDKTYAAVEKADAVQRRTGLDLRLARERHETAKFARVECERKLDSAEASKLRDQVCEAGYHEAFAPLLQRALDLDTKLCALHTDFTKATEEHNRKIRRLNEIQGRLMSGSPSTPLVTMSEAAWLTSALVSLVRRKRGVPTPSIDVSRPTKMGDLSEHLVTTRGEAGFSETVPREAEFAAKRFIETTTPKKEAA